MIGLSELRDLIHRISKMLGDSDERQYSAGFAGLLARTPMVVDEADIGTAARSIRAYFGKAGSFNDLILEREGIPLVEENDELDRLRRRFFEIEGELRERLSRR